MEKKRLVWLSVNCSYSHASPVLPMIHAACADLGDWEWFRVETTIEDDRADVASRIVSQNGNLVCATLYLFNRVVVLDILARVKALFPECHIAVGGPECLGEGADELLASCPFIDTVFRGEGEPVFPDFLKNFPPSSRSIVPPDGTAVYEKWTESAYPVKDEFFRVDKPFIQMETARGCPMGCAYCTSCGTSLRFRSLEAVAEELEALRKRNVCDIRLLDRTFNFPSERGAALLRMFRTRFPEIRFHLEIHPQFLNDELRSELLAATPGQLHIEAGVQSLDENVLRAVGRNGRTNEVLDGLRFLCSCTAFETHADLLAGLPGQNPEILYNDVAQLMEVGASEIQLEVLKILPGTPLRTNAGALGIIFAPNTPYDVMRTPEMSSDAILNARLLSRLLDLTYNHSALHPVMKAAYSDDSSFIRPLLTFFIAEGLDLNRLYDLRTRFRLLDAFFSKGSFGSARETLAIQWLEAGYPPEDYAEKIFALPENSILLKGDSEAGSRRETKFWKFSGKDADLCFAFNREFVMNRPAAVWRIGKGEN